MNVDRLIAAVAAATFLLAAGAVQAEDQPDGTSGASERPHYRGFKGPRGPGGPGAMPGQMLLRMADELNLSIEQQDSLQGLIDEFQPSWDSLRERMSASRSKMMGLTPDDPEYASVTQEVSQQAAAMAAEMVMLTSDFQARAYALLTEEQRQRLEELKSERRHYRRSWGPGDSA
jgi:Spy/CpxP family protein refolding chaperone